MLPGVQRTSRRLDGPDRGPALAEVFAEAFHPLVRSVLPLVGGCRATAEDVASEAFARAQARWGQVGGYDRPDLWLRRVAINLAISRHRKEHRVHQRGLDPAEGLEPEGISAPTAEVLDAVRRLPERQAQVVVLVYFAHESVAAAARTLEISESTARTHLARALERLAGELDDQEGHR